MATFTYIETINQSGFETMIFAQGDSQYVINRPSVQAAIETGDDSDLLRTTPSSNKYSNPQGRKNMSSAQVAELIEDAKAHVRGEN